MNCGNLLFVYVVITTMKTTTQTRPNDGSTGPIIRCSGETEQFGNKWVPIGSNDRLSVTRASSIAITFLKDAGKLADGYEFKDWICVDKPVGQWGGKLYRVKLLAEDKDSKNILECRAHILYFGPADKHLIYGPIYGGNECHCLDDGSWSSYVIRCYGNIDEQMTEFTPVDVTNEGLSECHFTSLAIELLKDANKLPRGYELEKWKCIEKTVGLPQINFRGNGELYRGKFLAKDKDSGDILECVVVFMYYKPNETQHKRLIKNIYGGNECHSPESMANMINKFAMAL